MRYAGTFASVLLCVVMFAQGALAHDPDHGAAGFLHVLTGIDHVPGFVILGVMTSAYMHLFGGRGWPRTGRTNA